MVSTQGFWDRISAYNQTTWPVQLLLIVVGAFLTYRVFTRPGPRTDAWMKAFLSFAFAWNAVFFLVFLKNPISMATAVPLFLIVSVLFAVDIFTRKTRFKIPDAGWKRWMTVLFLLLVLAYPAVGWFLVGHAYPRTLLPVMPCPLTASAIALVAAATPNADRKVFISLLPWALMGLPKCFGALDCYEDCILFAAGIYGLIVLIRSWQAARPDDRAIRHSPI